VGRPPHFHIEFYPYASLSHTIRLRGDTAFVRLSDLLRGAPLGVLEATAALLLSRIYRRPLPAALAAVYRRYSDAPGTRRQMHALRRHRGRRLHSGVEGKAHHLGEIFRRVNAEYFESRLAAPEIGWSTHAWQRQLGVFDPGLGHIVINRRLDREDVPPMAVAYVVFHEMLHLQQATGKSRCGLGVHSPEFRREEKRFREYEQARRFLMRLP
jgi:predicted metal-dependent hydrolase